MPAKSELLTMPEAAVVASVTVRDINRIIDEKILPDRFYKFKGGRRLHVEACALVAFYFHTSRALTSEERGLLIRKFSERIGHEAGHQPADWTINDGYLTVRLWDFVISTKDRLAKLIEARENVSEDPDILGGAPVIRGTRIPVHDVAASVAAGMPRERIRAAYGRLDDHLIDLAMIYAEAAPLRGRPKHSSMFPSNAKVLSKRSVRRRT